jgi:hypothetical protein
LEKLFAKNSYTNSFMHEWEREMKERLNADVE